LSWQYFPLNLDYLEIFCSKKAKNGNNLLQKYNLFSENGTNGYILLQKCQKWKYFDPKVMGIGRYERGYERSKDNIEYPQFISWQSAEG
jgi:hypothetical protein